MYRKISVPDQNHRLNSSQSCQEQRQSPGAGPPGNKGSDLPGRLGAWIWTLIIISVLVLMASIGVLTWFWFAPPSSSRWRAVVLSPYFTQAITITGILIRTSTGILAVKTTAMIVSIAVERQGVLAQDVAPMSILRYSNAGPMSLVEFLFNGESFGVVLHLLTALVLVVTTACQFTSTLLFADLTFANITGFPESASNAYSITPVQNLDSLRMPSISTAPFAVQGYASYWNRRPSTLETFAEYAEPGLAVKDEDVDDTGPSIRALLPVPQQSDREMLREFQGMARVLDTRTTCVRPTLSNLRFCDPSLTNGALSLCGNYSRDHLPEHLWFSTGWDDTDETSFTDSFECPLSDSSKPEYDWSLCNMISGGVMSSLTNETAEFVRENSFGSSFLVWNSGSVLRQIPGSIGSTGLGGSPWLSIENKTSGPWFEPRGRYSDTLNRTFEVSIQATLCFEAVFQLQIPIDHLNITARSKRVIREPRLVWDAEAETFDTAAAQHQLGATTDTTSYNQENRRQILTISPNDMRAQLRAKSGKPLTSTDTDWTDLLSSKLTTTASNMALSPLSAPDVSGVEISDALLATIFHRTIQDTGSPARALQAWRTLLIRMVYYDYLGACTANSSSSSSDATVTKFLRVLAPPSSTEGGGSGRRCGFWIVVAVVVAQVALFILVGCWFGMRTQSSFPDNAWHTVGQVAAAAIVVDCEEVDIDRSDESHILRGILAESCVATDEKIGYWVRGDQPPRTWGGKAFAGLLWVIGPIGNIFRPCLPFIGKTKEHKERYVVRDGRFVRATGLDTHDSSSELLRVRRRMSVSE